jgi:hypothetical protein
MVSPSAIRKEKKRSADVGAERKVIVGLCESRRDMNGENL